MTKKDTLLEILLFDDNKPMFTQMMYCGFSVALVALFVKSLHWWLANKILMPELTIFGFVMVMIIFVVMEMTKRVSTWLGLYMVVGFLSILNEGVLPIVAVVMSAHIVIDTLVRELLRVKKPN